MGDVIEFEPPSKSQFDWVDEGLQGIAVGFGVVAVFNVAEARGKQDSLHSLDYIEDKLELQNAQEVQVETYKREIRGDMQHDVTTVFGSATIAGAALIARVFRNRAKRRAQQ